MGALKTISIISLITFIIIGIVGGYMFYKVKDLKDVKIEDSNVYVANVTSDSFTLKGYMVINNPSNTEIPFKTINYQITLEETGETMATGEIPASKIAKQNTTRIEFEQKITIPPSTDQLMSQPNIYALIEAGIILDYPIINKFPIPFKQKIDIKPQIQQMAWAGLPINL